MASNTQRTDWGQKVLSLNTYSIFLSGISFKSRHETNAVRADWKMRFADLTVHFNKNHFSKTFAPHLSDSTKITLTVRGETCKNILMVMGTGRKGGTSGNGGNKRYRKACNTQKKLYERGFNSRTLCWILSKSSPVYLTDFQRCTKEVRREEQWWANSQLMHLEMPKSTIRLLHLESVWMATTSSFSITMIRKSLSVHWKYTWIEKCPMEHYQACNGLPKARNEGRLEIFQSKIKTFAVLYVRNAEVCKSMHLKMQWIMWKSQSGRVECQRNQSIWSFSIKDPKMNEWWR